MVSHTAQAHSIFSSKWIGYLHILSASLFLGLCSQIQIPLFFTPIPLTLQTAAVMSIALVLGGQKALVAILCYFVEASLGLPFWAGGHSGFMHFMGPTGGYLLGFILQVYWIGRYSHSSPRTLFTSMVLSCFLQLGLGTLWLAQFVGWNRCMILGFFPFVTMEMAKACGVASIFSALKRLRLR